MIVWLLDRKYGIRARRFEKALALCGSGRRFGWGGRGIRGWGGRGGWGWAWVFVSLGLLAFYLLLFLKGGKWNLNRGYKIRIVWMVDAYFKFGEKRIIIEYHDMEE